ncbi:MAG: endonuclease/exonuclease/phosphatase family protein [Anaerolineales bacterium]
MAQGTLQAGRPVIVTGDFNTAYAEIDLARPRENVNHSGFMPEEDPKSALKNPLLEKLLCAGVPL